MKILKKISKVIVIVMAVLATIWCGLYVYANYYSMIYLENFPSLIIQNLKNGYCSISIVHAMISHSEQQIIL